MKLCHLPSIGMRNIKTALSVFICLLAFAIMGPDFNPMFACVAAVVCMGSSIEDSVTAGWNRILGTIIGGLAGMLGIFLCNIIPWHQAYMGIMPLGIIALIYLCNTMKKSGAIIMCCVMFISVMTTYPPNIDSYLLAVLRLLETSFGVVVAFLINRFVKVPDCKKEEEDIKETINEPSSKKIDISHLLNFILKP